MLYIYILCIYVIYIYCVYYIHIYCVYIYCVNIYIYKYIYIYTYIYTCYTYVYAKMDQTTRPRRAYFWVFFGSGHRWRSNSFDGGSQVLQSGRDVVDVSRKGNQGLGSWWNFRPESPKIKIENLPEVKMYAWISGMITLFIAPLESWLESANGLNSGRPMVWTAMVLERPKLVSGCYVQTCSTVFL